MNLKTSTKRIFHRMTRSFLQFFALIWRGISETFVFIRRSMGSTGLWRSPNKNTAPRTVARPQKLGWRGQWRYWQARWQALRTQKHRPYRTPKERLKRLVVLSFTTFVFTVQFAGLDLLFHIKPALAATTIAIEPITWDFVGLDSNKPESQGPNTYVVGARVCNLGTEDALNVTVKFNKDGVDNGYAFIQLQAGDTYTFDRIPADDGSAPIRATNYVFDTRDNGSLPKSKYQLSATPQYCQDFYYNFEVTRTASAWNTYQRYYIEASGSNTNYVATERPRQNYIEKLISQARNEVYYFGCDPAGGSTYATGAVTVQVGDTFTCEARAHTASAYPQMSFTADIPNVIFQVLKVNSTYSNPTGGINSTVYADGCGWVSDPTDPRYHLSPGACSSETGFTNTYSDQYPYTAPPAEGKGAVGNDIVTRYTIKVLAFPNGIPNPIRVSNVMLDYSGSSYHYNADYGIAPNLIDITVANPNPTDLIVDKSHSDPFGYGNKTYTLTVSDNANGTGAKSPVTLTDTLPTGYTFVDQNLSKVGIQPLSGTDAANWNCGTSGQVLTCLYDTNGDSIGDNFPDGGSNTLILNVNIPTTVPSGTTSTNFAKVTLNTAQTDSNLANNTDSDPTTVLQGVDIVLVKDDNVNDPTESTFNGDGTGTATYRITATNDSGTNASGPLTVVDTLPVGFKFTGTYSGTNNGTNWICNATDVTGSVVICTNSRGLNDPTSNDGDGETTTINLTVNVLSSAEDMYTDINNPPISQLSGVNPTGLQAINKATISSASNEINYNNNTAYQVNNFTKPAPDLVISKTDNGIDFVQGTANKYYITVQNLTGANIIPTTGTTTVTDFFPGPSTQITYTSATNAPGSSGWTCSASLTALTPAEVTAHPTSQGKFTCTNPNPIAPGDSSQIEVNVSIPAGATAGTILTNKARVDTPDEINTGDGNYTTANDNDIQDTSNIITTARVVDVQVTKTLNGAVPVNIGDSISYRMSIVLNNTGNDIIAGTGVFEDLIPSSITISGTPTCTIVNTGNGTGSTSCCTPSVSGQQVTCNGYSMRKTAQLDIIVNGTINRVGNIFNTATVSPGVGLQDSVPANNVSSTLTVVPSPDLSLSKSVVEAAPYNQGDFITYRLTVSNTSSTQGSSGSMTVIDPLPAGVEYVSAGNAPTSSGWICSHNDVTNTVVCGRTSSLAASASTSIDILVKLIGSGTINNGDTFRGTNPTISSISKPNNTTTATVTTSTAHGYVSGEMVEISSGNASLNGTYSITVTGANTFTYTTSAPGNLSANSGTVFLRSQDRQIVKLIKVGDPNVINNASNASITVQPSNVDLKITKTEQTAPFSIGQTEVYRLTVKNFGTTTALGPLTIVDQLPAGLTFQYANTVPAASLTSPAIETSWSCSPSGQTITCINYSNLAANTSTGVDLYVQVGNTASGNITNQARVTSFSDICTDFTDANCDDDNATNPAVNANGERFDNKTSLTTTINTLADLAVVKTAVDQNTTLANTQFYQDGTAVYNITVTNNGPSAYSGTVTINENLAGITPSDPNFTYVSHSDSATWSCTNVATSGACAAGAKNLRFAKTGGLLAGESSTITLRVNVPDGLTGTFTNTATIDAATITAANDTNTSNNSDPDTVDVLDNTTTLTLLKDDNDGESPNDEPTSAEFQSKFVKQGVGKYTIVARNSGPSPAKAPVTISDTLPSGLTYAGNSQTANWSCTGTLGSQNFSCIYGVWTDTDNDGDRFDVGGSLFTQQDLPVGAASGVEIRVNVLSSATTSTLSGSVYTGLTTNSASVSGSNFATVNASEQTAIVDPADLAVTKAIGALTAGGTGTYTITVTNNGPGISYPQIYLQDYLPTGLTYSGATSGTAGGDGTWTIIGYNDTANEVTYRRSTALAVGATTTISLPVNVSASAPGSVTNFIRVGGFTPEPDYDANTPGYQDPILATCDTSFGANQPVNNCFALTSTVTGGVSTDLSITKIHGVADNDDPPSPAVNFNTNYSYTLRVANLSTTNAETVTVSDVLPTWLEYVSYSIDAGDLTIPNPYGSTPANLNRICGYATGSRTFSCNLLRVSTAENATDPVDITLTVRSLVSGVVNNTATVASVTADTITANNTESEGVLINAGGTNTISGRVFNDIDNGGPTDQDAGETGTQNVKVNLYLDNGGVLGTYDPGDTLVATTTTNASGDYSFTTNLTGNFVLTVDTTTLPAGHQLTPTGSAVTSQPAVLTTPGSNDINNNFGHRSLSLPTVDIAITKTDSADPINVGGSFDYTLTVSSDPTNSANNVVVTDTIPASLTINSVTPGSPTCTVSGQVVTCNLGTVAANSANQVITINVTSTVAGTVTNTATVTTDNPEGNTANNSDSEQTVVNAPVAGGTTCYAVADGGDRLVTLNIDALTAAAAPGVLGAPDVEAIAYNPFTDILYGADADRFGTINTTTGAFTFVGSFGSSSNGAAGLITFDDIDGLAFNPYTGELFGAQREDEPGKSDVLIKINPATGAFIPNAFGTGVDYLVINTGATYANIDDITIDPFDGTFYAVANEDNFTAASFDQFVKVNLTDGSTTTVGSFGVADVEGLTVFNNGNIYLTTGDQPADGIDDSFYTVNKTSGAGTKLIDLGSFGADYEGVSCFTGAPNIISGRVFLDDGNGGGTANDGILNGTEAGTNGVTVRLYRDVDGSGTVNAGDLLLTSQVTAGGGNYSFTVAATGAFVLDIDTATLPAGQALTSDNLEVANFGTNLGLTDANNNFGHNVGDQADLLLVKRITAVRRNGVTLGVGDRLGGQDTAIFNNFGTAADEDNAANWPANDDVYLRGAINGGEIQTGDEIEYTIYFLNNGAINAGNVTLCDVVPENMTYVPSSMSLFLDNSSPLDDPASPNVGTFLTALTAPNSLSDAVGDGDRGAYYAPGVLPQPNNLCRRGTTNIVSAADNTTGAVVIRVVSNTTTPNNIAASTAPGTPVNSYGFIRFRAVTQ